MIYTKMRKAVLLSFLGFSLAFPVYAQQPDMSQYAWPEPQGAQVKRTNIAGHDVAKVANKVEFLVDIQPKPQQVTFSFVSRLFEVSSYTFSAQYDPGKKHWRALVDTTKMRNGTYWVSVHDDSTAYSGSGAPYLLMVHNKVGLLEELYDQLLFATPAQLLTLLAIMFLLGAACAWYLFKRWYRRRAQRREARMGKHT
jgi:hypothetical protein